MECNNSSCAHRGNIWRIILWDQVTRVSAADLQKIIQRDGVPIVEQGIPEEVLDQLAAYRVLVVGELLFLGEHHELIADLLLELRDRGFRKYLFEWTQAADWLLVDYVNEGGLLTDWTPPHDIGGEVLTAIREFNRTIPEGERIQVHGIDVALEDYGGAASFVIITDLLAKHLTNPGPISSFLEGDHGSSEGHQSELEIIQSALESDRSVLINSWGEAWYNTVLEMVEVELKAVGIRSIRDSDYDASVRLREEIIK